MPFNATLSSGRVALPKPEILAYPLDTTIIDSVVIRAAGVPVDASGPYTGRYYLLQGTLLFKRAGNLVERYTGAVGQQIDGILYDTVEFADNTTASNEPAAMLRKNMALKTENIVDYLTLSADVITWAGLNGVDLVTG